MLPPPGRAELVEELLATPAGELVLRRPADPSALISEESFAADEYLPYWAERWPSSDHLVAALPTSLDGARVLELGCGLGVPSLVAARLGAEVLAVDWSEDAVRLLKENARRNGVTLEARRVDWRAPDGVLAGAPYDLVLAADVCYEQRNVAPLSGLLRALASTVLFADPGRQPAEALMAELEACFELEWVAERVRRLTPKAAMPASESTTAAKEKESGNER